MSTLRADFAESAQRLGALEGNPGFGRPAGKKNPRCFCFHMFV